jgi:thioredoxin 1
MEEAPLVEGNDLIWENTVEKEEKPVAVMFYSPSCAFCHQMEPYFKGYAQEFRDSVIFVRMNIVSNQWTAERYGAPPRSNSSVTENLCRR